MTQQSKEVHLSSRFTGLVINKSVVTLIASYYYSCKFLLASILIAAAVTALIRAISLLSVTTMLSLQRPIHLRRHEL